MFSCRVITVTGMEGRLQMKKTAVKSMASQENKMKILKPNIVKELEPVEDPLQFIRASQMDETDIAAKLIKDVSFENADLSKLCFKEVAFENCRFITCSFSKTDFIDVTMRSCDFSNSDMDEGYFNRCELVSCKGVGVNLQYASLQNLTVSDCNFQYANTDSAKIKNVSVVNSDISHASVTECKLSNLELDGVKLISTNFFKTLLKDIDFTKSRIEGILVSGEELKGAIVNSVQASELAKLLGLIIK